MASYLYRSATGSNWDDEDGEEFSFDNLESAAVEYSASTSEESTSEESTSEECPPSPSAVESRYESIHSDYWPCAAWSELERQNNEKLRPRRPAYVELSYDGGVYFSDTRYHYNSHWLATKLEAHRDITVPALMKSSPLRKSMVWEKDSKGEYIKEDGFLEAGLLDLFNSPPSLFYDSQSGSEEDEACSPPESPSMISTNLWRGEVKQVSELVEHSDWFPTNIDRYDPVTAVIDFPSNEEDIEIDISCEFVEFSSISDTLDISDILGDAARNMLHNFIDKPIQCHMAYSHDQLEEVSIADEATWDERDDLEDLIHDRNDTTVSFPPPSSHDQGGAEEKRIHDITTASPTIINSSGVSCNPVADLITVNTMARHLITIVKEAHTQLSTGAPLVDKTPIEITGAESGASDEVSETHNAAPGLVESVKKAQDTTELDITVVTVIYTSVPHTKPRLNDFVVDSKQPQDVNLPSAHVLNDFTTPTKTISPSPDLAYIHDPSNNSLIWNTVATGWFAISSIPWGRIAIATAGTLVDVAAFVARH